MIHVRSLLEPPPIAPELVRRAADAALAHEAAAGDLAVMLADDALLQSLNHQYLGIDAPTDVLAFAGSEPDPESGAAYLGDIAISLAQAEAQALAAGHPTESEVQLLVVHGVLHLLGYDHGEEQARSRMWAVQGEVLRGLGMPESVIPGL
jgi:probable rRNA maturation factor